MRAFWLLMGLIVAATGCASSIDFAEPIVDRSAAPQDQAVDLTLEEAGFLASGQLISLYGLDADPVAIEVKSEIVDSPGAARHHRRPDGWRTTRRTCMADVGRHPYRWTTSGSTSPAAVMTTVHSDRRVVLGQTA